jgi:hypothetical protein
MDTLFLDAPIRGRLDAGSTMTLFFLVSSTMGVSPRKPAKPPRYFQHPFRNETTDAQEYWWHHPRRRSEMTTGKTQQHKPVDDATRVETTGRDGTASGLVLLPRWVVVVSVSTIVGHQLVHTQRPLINGATTGCWAVPPRQKSLP